MTVPLDLDEHNLSDVLKIGIILDISVFLEAILVFMTLRPLLGVMKQKLEDFDYRLGNDIETSTT